MSASGAAHAPAHQLRVVGSRQFHDPVSDLGEAIQREQVVAVDLLAVEVLHDPLAQDVLRVRVLPEPDHADLGPHMGHERDRRIAKNRRLRGRQLRGWGIVDEKLSVRSVASASSS